MKTTIKKFETGKTSVYYDEPSVHCLCSVTESESGPILPWDCDWADGDSNYWEVAVLDDGTAVTWCTNY
jgi:hypothetical protein